MKILKSLIIFMKQFNFLSKLLNSWKDEYHEDVRYGLKGRKLIEKKSKFQTITIFESKR